MAASTKSTVKDLTLSKVLNEKYEGNPYRKWGRSLLLDIADDVIIAWSKEDGCLLVQLLQPPDSKVQVLGVSRVPVWEVERVLVNSSCNYVALIGSRGVGVVQLPQRYGDPPLYDGGQSSITCRVDYIAERFFACHPKLEVMEAAWHPGSLDSNHMVVLASDNYLRIYSLSSHEIPEQAIPVGSSNYCVIKNSGFSSGLGENAVSFDFGTPSEAVKHFSGNPVSSGLKESVIDPDEERKQSYLALEWPVFILYGNGDVYYTNITLRPSRLGVTPVHGPLSMSPQAENNYGLDWCSILLLPSTPPVVVICTPSGQVHHCIVISTEEDDENNARGIVSAPVKLHVYESVDLELSTLATDESSSFPIMLHRDPTSQMRYWVSHEAGVHGVTVPLVEHLLRFSELPDDAAFSGSELQCVVDHLVCTQSISPVGPMPVVGLAVTPARLLYILLASGRIMSIRLSVAFTSLMPESSTTELGITTSPLRKVHSEHFEEYIRSILRRSSSQPLLASGSSSSVTPDDYLNLLNQVMHTLRTNYVLPQVKAKEEIQRRSDILVEQKQRLEKDIADLQEKKRSLSEKAHELAEKYEEANDKKAALIGRLERVVSQVMRSLPVLTTGEKSMLQELRDMEMNLLTFTNQLSQIKAKDEWQTSQMEKLKNSDNFKGPRSGCLTESQLKALEQALSKESEKLSGLKEKVNQMKRDLQL